MLKPLLFRPILPIGWPELTISGSFAAGLVGVYYNSALSIAGGSGNYLNLTVVSGTLPSWASLAIDGNHIVLSGTLDATSSGSITVRVESTDGQSADSTQSLVIDDYVTVPNIVSLLHFDGADGSTTFTDQVARTWTSLGGKLSTLQSKFGGSSYKPIANGRVSTPSTPFNFNQPFTVQCFAFIPVGSNGGNIFNCDGSSGSYEGHSISISKTAVSATIMSHGWQGSGEGVSVASASSEGQWYHIEVSRGSDGILRIFKDGVLLYSGAKPAGMAPAGRTMYLGGWYAAGSDFQGYIDEFCFSSSVLHTSNFTPPPTPIKNP